MIVFESSSKGHFVIREGIEDLVKEVKDIIATISNNNQDNFIADCNETLFQDLMSRKIAVEFFKKFDIDPNYLTVLISYVYDNNTYKVSLGKLPDPKDPKGPIKIVESRYID